MGFYTQHATDINLEKQGAWFDLGDGDRIKIRRSGLNNKDFQAFLASNDIENLKDNYELATRGFADYIVVDIDVEDFDGSKMQYNHDNVIKILNVPEIFSAVIEASAKADIFRHKKVEKIVKK